MEDTDLTEELNWTEAAVKGRTKREIYRILQMKGKFYLPPESQTNSDFIHDIMALKMHDVVMTHAPHIQGLRVFQIISMAKQHCNIDQYLPELKDDKLPSREFVVNVERLQEMVEKAMTRREYKLIKQRNITMNVLPEIKRIFSDTKEVSRENGRFYHLVKNTDAKRARRSINDENEEEKKQSSSQLDRKNQIISDLQLQIQDFEDKMKENEKNAAILTRLFEGGIIDGAGELMIEQHEEE